MKKVIISLFIIPILFSIGIFTAYGVNETQADSWIREYTSDIEKILDEETLETLKQLGLNEITAENIFNLSFTQVLKNVGEIFKFNLKDHSNLFFKMLSLLIVLISANSLKSEKSLFSNQLSDIATVITAILVVAGINNSISKAVTAFDLTGKLILTYAPVLTVLLSITGNLTASTLYNSGLVALAQVFSAFSENILIPFIGMYFALIIALSLNKNVNSSKITGSLNKIITGSISFMTMIFTLLISGKNILASDIDGILYKSGKYLISNFIPIIGPGISSVFNSIIGSLSLVKSTVGIFAIICTFVINLPVLISLILDYISLYAMSLIADSFGEKQIHSIFNGFSNGIKILITIIIFELVLVIISTGLILTIKGEM